jgi:outer membrane lipoprotein
MPVAARTPPRPTPATAASSPAAGFYDPAVFEAGRDVTFIGKIDGYQNTRIGEYDYRLPKLSADVIYLWPEQRQVDVVPYPYGPWGPGPYGPYWGGYGRWGWW